MMKRVFYGETPEHLQHVKEAGLTVTIPLLALAFITILLGIYPGLVTERLLPVIASVLGGGAS